MPRQTWLTAAALLSVLVAAAVIVTAVPGNDTSTAGGSSGGGTEVGTTFEGAPDSSEQDLLKWALGERFHYLHHHEMHCMHDCSWRAGHHLLRAAARFGHLLASGAFRLCASVRMPALSVCSCFPGFMSSGCLLVYLGAACCTLPLLLLLCGATKRTGTDAAAAAACLAQPTAIRMSSGGRQRTPSVALHRAAPSSWSASCACSSCCRP